MSWTGGREFPRSETRLRPGDGCKGGTRGPSEHAVRWLPWGGSPNVSLTSGCWVLRSCCRRAEGRYPRFARCGTARRPPSSALVQSRIEKRAVKMRLSMSHWEGKVVFLDVFRSQRSVAKDEKREFHVSEHKSATRCFALTIPW